MSRCDNQTDRCKDTQPLFFGLSEALVYENERYKALRGKLSSSCPGSGACFLKNPSASSCWMHRATWHRSVRESFFILWPCQIYLQCLLSPAISEHLVLEMGNGPQIGTSGLKERTTIWVWSLKLMIMNPFWSFLWSNIMCIKLTATSTKNGVLLHLFRKKDDEAFGCEWKKTLNTPNSVTDSKSPVFVLWSPRTRCPF